MPHPSRHAAVALVASLLAAAPAAAAPKLTLDAPESQRPDHGFGTVFSLNCSPECDVTFTAEVVRRGQPLPGIATFSTNTGRIGEGPGWYGWNPWYLSERRRLARALRDGPVGLRIDASATDATGTSERSITLRLRRPRLPPPARRMNDFEREGFPFRLPTPPGHRWINPGALVGADDEGDNAIVVPDSAQLPFSPYYLEWDYSVSPAVGGRKRLERRARRLVAARFRGPSRPRFVGRVAVDEAKAFQFAVGSELLTTIAFYGDYYHEVDCSIPEGRRRAARTACKRVLRGASLAF